MENLEKELRSIIAEITEIEPEKITMEARFVEDLGMDSMMALEILASIEKKYKIQIPESKLMSLLSLKDTVNLTTEYLKQG
ncbi:MAG: acyl carrier protein [Candidatus Omnitrophica bacterium]|nr:acyl carrier protein [Candidatus Omnitrophota bacterium]